MTDQASRIAEWRAGWPVVLASACGIGTGAALYQYVSSLFIGPAQTELGWSRGDFALIGATPLIGALSAPLIGRLADRYGVRPVAIIATITIAGAFFGLSQQGGSVAEAVAWMLLLGFAVPGTTGIVYSRAVTGWFSQNRGLALGLMSSGISIGALLATPLIAWAIGVGGLSGGYMGLALLALCIGLPAILWGLRERVSPAVARQVGWVDDARPDAAMSGPSALRSLLATRRFWLLAAVMFLVNIPSSGILTQLTPLLTDKGVARETATLLLSLYAGSVLAGRIGIGWLFDRLPAPRVAAAVTLVAAVGCIAFHSATPMAFVYAGVVTVGLMQGAETDVLAYFVSRLFDHRHFGTIYGLQVTGGMTGTAIGIIGFGQLYDRQGSYDVVLLIGAAMLVVVAGLYLSLSGAMAAARDLDGASAQN